MILSNECTCSLSSDLFCYQHFLSSSGYPTPYRIGLFPPSPYFWPSSADKKLEVMSLSDSIEKARGSDPSLDSIERKSGLHCSQMTPIQIVLGHHHRTLKMFVHNNPLSRSNIHQCMISNTLHADNSDNSLSFLNTVFCWSVLELLQVDLTLEADRLVCLKFKLDLCEHLLLLLLCVHC